MKAARKQGGKEAKTNEARKQTNKNTTSQGSKGAGRQRHCQLRLHGLCFSLVGAVHWLALIWSRRVSLCVFAIHFASSMHLFIGLARDRRSIGSLRRLLIACRSSGDVWTDLWPLLLFVSVITAN